MKQEWKKYEGDYEKEGYDIMLKDGTIIENCWPNARTFHALDGSGRVVNDNLIVCIRKREPWC
jgi:hypothetical protein